MNLNLVVKILDAIKNVILRWSIMWAKHHKIYDNSNHDKGVYVGTYAGLS